METEQNLKTIIGNNIFTLMSVYNLSRKELCSDTGIKYTTLCDWLSYKSYPRIDTLELLSAYFHIEIEYFFRDIQKDEARYIRIKEYAERLRMKNNYKHTYPEYFSDLFGSLADFDIEEPEDAFPEEDIEKV